MPTKQSFLEQYHRDASTCERLCFPTRKIHLNHPAEEHKGLPDRVALLQQDSARVAHVDIRVAASRSLPQSSSLGAPPANVPRIP